MSDDLEVLFRGLPDEDSRAFLALGVSVPFEAGQVILPAGRSDWDIYVIEAGELSVWVGYALIGTFKRGQTIDTSSILFPQIQWSAVRSDTAGRLLKIQREAVMGFFESRAQRVFQQFCVNLFKVWVEVLRDRNARIADIQGELLYAPKPGAKERYSILVVDDEAMAEFFGERYDVITAPDGAGAIESALTRVSRVHEGVEGLDPVQIRLHHDFVQFQDKSQLSVCALQMRLLLLCGHGASLSSRFYMGYFRSPRRIDGSQANTNILLQDPCRSGLSLWSLQA